MFYGAVNVHTVVTIVLTTRLQARTHHDGLIHPASSYYIDNISPKILKICAFPSSGSIYPIYFDSAFPRVICLRNGVYPLCCSHL